MGTFTPKLNLYKPTLGETGWDNEVNDGMDQLDIVASLYLNVKQSPYNAVGDGVADDTAEIQAALDAAVSAGAGTVVFPKGIYKISAPLVIGNNTTALSIVLEGADISSGPNPSQPQAYIIQSAANTDGIQVENGSGVSNSVVIRGLRIDGQGIGETSIGIDIAAGSGAQSSGTILERCYVQAFGTGYKLGNAVQPRLIDCTAHTCGFGVNLTTAAAAGTTLASLTRYTGQACTNAVRVNTLTYGASFDTCIFEGCTGPAILIDTDGALANPRFDSCWWEINASDMVRLAGTAAGGSLTGAVFDSCYFDGSNGSGGRHVFNNTGPDYTFGNGITFNGGGIYNLNGGKFFNIATDPNSSVAAGYMNLTIHGMSGAGDIKGVHTSITQPSVVDIRSAAFTTANIIVSGAFGLKPQYMLGGSTVVVGLEMNAPIEMAEQSDPAAPAANLARFYTRDNGAGKTQIVARFPTGAIQVIATEP